MSRMSLYLLMSVGLLLGAEPINAEELGIGDPAPELQIAKWVKGAPVDLASQKGKGVVVLEFWATWCGPCIVSIPDLTALQEKYKAKGVTVIGVTKFDEGNTLEMVKKFTRKQGDKMGYTIAFEKDPKTYDAYMTAAGQNGIPTSFVIDHSGRIAWIGHPMSGLDEVIEEIVAGKYDIAVAKKIAVIRKRLWDPEVRDDPQLKLQELRHWIELEPDDPGPYMRRFRIYTGDLDSPADAVRAAKQAISAADRRPKTLGRFAVRLVDEAHKHAYDKLATRAMNRAYEQAPDESSVMVARFEVLASTGQEAEALIFAEGAVHRLKDDPRSLSELARVIAAPERTDRCNELAVRAVDLAIAAEPDEPAHLQSKFRIQAICQKNVNAAEGTGRYLIEKAGDEAGLLNNFAWDLLTHDDLQGKFTDLALAAAEKCDQVSESKNWMYIDTLALAKFESGAVADAVRLQKKAIELCESEAGLSEIKERLKQFEEAIKK